MACNCAKNNVLLLCSHWLHAAGGVQLTILIGCVGEVTRKMLFSDWLMFQREANKVSAVL